MNEQLLIWILPGFVGYFSYQNFRKTIPAHRGNWDFVISLGIFSVISTKITQNIFSFSDQEATTLLFINTASGVALLMGVIFSFIYNFLVESGKINNPVDRFTEECMKNFEKPVMIILKSNKLYVGFLSDYDRYSRGENSSDRTITLLPLMSSKYDGKRVSEMNVYDKDELRKDVKNITFLVREIESLRPFSQKLFLHFTAQT